MTIEIITPVKQLFKGEVSMASFPGSDGSFGVLNNHAPIVATLKKGAIRLKVTDPSALQFDDESGTMKHDISKDGELSIEVNGGVVEMSNNNVIVLAE
jgi:F-type H+-transporting ATPase subunit epsilon